MRSFTSIIMLFFTLQASAAMPETVPEKVATALKLAGIPQSSVAIYVQAVDVEASMLQIDSTKSMNPASVMKLVTTEAGLEMLQPTYRWKTEVYTDGEIVAGTLKGNLILKGYGDPSFNEAAFRRLLVRLQQAGIQRIEGDLIIDKSYFSSEIANRAVFDQEPWRAYNAMPSAFLVDGRKTSFRFSINNGNLEIQQEVSLSALNIINEVKLTKQPCDNWRGDLAYDVTKANDAAIVKFSGSIPETCDEKYLELSIFNDEQYAFLIFKQLWSELSGQFFGKLGTPITASTTKVVNMKPLLTQYSEPLGSIIRDINKWSNNLMARQLLLTIAAERNTIPAIEANGLQAIKSWLSLQNISSNSLIIENGAGLSRVERLDAKFLGELLVSAYHRPTMPEFIASLPILSLDGTVQKRLNGSLLSGRGHLKTGSIDGVSTIAGYVLNAKNQLFVMVMLVNDAKAYASRAAQDALITWVYAQP